jgi:hypothetical protein
MTKVAGGSESERKIIARRNSKHIGNTITTDG